MNKTESLKSNFDFKKLYDNKNSYANKFLIMYIRENGTDSNRLGISVSKKVGNSVVRHRTTRLIRQSYLGLKDELPDGFHFVVIARSDAANKKQQDMDEALRHLFKLQGLV